MNLSAEVGNGVANVYIDHMTNTTTTAPATYAKAAAVAEQITLDELAELLAADDNPDVYPGKGKRRQIAMSAKLRTHVTNSGRTVGFVGYDRCTFGTGYTTFDGVTVGYRYDRPVFRFERLDRVRIVQVVAPA
jgi:hypothetical protein